ncbi:MAG: hypothetical protein ACRBCS_10020 [Cellvibrionaceae bacterium]
MITQHSWYQSIQKAGLFSGLLLICTFTITAHSETVFKADLSKYYTLDEDTISYGYYGLRIRGSRSNSPYAQLAFFSEECENITTTTDYRTRGLDSGEEVQIYFSPAGSDFGLVGSLSERSGTFTHKPQASWNMYYKIYNGASSFFERIDISNLVIRGDDADNCRDGDCNCVIGSIDN